MFTKRCVFVEEELKLILDDHMSIRFAGVITKDFDTKPVNFAYGTSNA